MVTLYLAGTSIGLESKIAVGEHMLNKYKKVYIEMPKEFYICKTRKGCFAYLTSYYKGEDVVEAATKLEKENERLIEELSMIKETTSFDQNTESESEPELLGIVYLYAM